MEICIQDRWKNFDDNGKNTDDKYLGHITLTQEDVDRILKEIKQLRKSIWRRMKDYIIRELKRQALLQEKRHQRWRERWERWKQLREYRKKRAQILEECARRGCLLPEAIQYNITWEEVEQEREIIRITNAFLLLLVVGWFLSIFSDQKQRR